MIKANRVNIDSYWLIFTIHKAAVVKILVMSVSLSDDNFWKPWHTKFILLIWGIRVNFVYKLIRSRSITWAKKCGMLSHQSPPPHLSESMTTTTKTVSALCYRGMVSKMTLGNSMHSYLCRIIQYTHLWVVCRRLKGNLVELNNLQH